MKDTQPRTPRNVSPYLLKRLRSVEEATADVQSRALRGGRRRPRDPLAVPPGRDAPDEPTDR